MDFKPFIGKNGLLSQANGDQGDTSQRVGTFAVLSFLAHRHGYYRDEETLYGGYFRDLLMLDCRNGRYRRNADTSSSESDAEELSRDQKSILMLSMAVLGFRCKLKEAFLAQVKRFGFHQNSRKNGKFNFPDIMLPVEVAVLIRGCSWWLLWPLLCLIDIGFLLDLGFRKRKPWDYDNMMAQQLFYAVTKYPTPTARLAFYFYKKTDFMDRIKEYHTYENGIPPLYELFVCAYNSIKKES